MTASGVTVLCGCPLLVEFEAPTFRKVPRKMGHPAPVSSADKVGQILDDGTRLRENITDWALEQFRAERWGTSLS